MFLSSLYIYNCYFNKISTDSFLINRYEIFKNNDVQKKKFFFCLIYTYIQKKNETKKIT